MMKTDNLGRLERVSLREIWESEPADFTPWLAKDINLKLLGDTLGIELQLEAVEKGIGLYSADIVCKDTADDTWVIIENQLEPTDHRHLGQILTYAAGIGAVTIVWIAERFTDEHRAALDWINEISNEDIQFFGLEIEAWRIGNSPVAPKFNIVAKPNDWTKGGLGSSKVRNVDLTSAKLLQQEFWRGFREYVLDKESAIKPTKALPQHWMNISIGRTGFKLTAIASLYDSETSGYNSNEIRAEFEINDHQAKEYYSLIEKDKDKIEEDMGEPLIWYNPENARVCRIFVRKSTDLNKEGLREEQYEWLLGKLEKLYEVFAPRVKAIRL